MIDYIKLHKEAWEKIAYLNCKTIVDKMVDKSIVVKNIAIREDINAPHNSCFLCQEVIDRLHHLDCKFCKGKWPVKCYNEHSLYAEWHNKKNPERKKELALKIANICD